MLVFCKENPNPHNIQIILKFYIGGMGIMGGIGDMGIIGIVGEVPIASIMLIPPIKAHYA